MKIQNIVTILTLLTLLIALFAGPTACTVRIVENGWGRAGQQQLPPQGHWVRTDREVGRDHHKAEILIEVGSHELTREEKITLQGILIEKAKIFSEQNHKAPTKEQVTAWGREVESRPFEVRLSSKETGKPVYEPYETPKVIRQTLVAPQAVPEGIRRQYRVLPPIYGGQ